jgi:hypothetical protein
MDKDKYDDMLQKMTLEVINLYETESDKVLRGGEAIELNDLLDLFFNEKV